MENNTSFGQAPVQNAYWCVSDGKVIRHIKTTEEMMTNHIYVGTPDAYIYGPDHERIRNIDLLLELHQRLTDDIYEQELSLDHITAVHRQSCTEYSMAMSRLDNLIAEKHKIEQLFKKEDFKELKTKYGK